MSGADRNAGLFEKTRPSQELFEVFLARYISPHTRRAYRQDWKKFSEECSLWFGVRIDSENSQDFSLFREELVLAWLRESEAKDTSLSAVARARRSDSRRRILACLSAFARFLCKKGVLDAHPLALLPKARPARQVHERSEALTESEMERLLEHVSQRAREAQALDGSAYHDRLKRASCELTEVVIWTLLTVGMRVSELTKLRIKDFLSDSQGFRLLLHSKGGGRHDPFVPPQTAQKIRIYLEKYRQNARGDEPLFIRAQPVKQVSALTQFGVFKLVVRSARDIGVDRPISPHSLRASLATALIRQQAPLAHVRDLLGHQSIRTTSIYLKRVHARSEAATLQLDVGQLFGRPSGEGDNS